MFRVQSILVFAFLIGPAQAMNYYVSAGGHDGDTGLSPDHTFLSITAVNQRSFQPGDVIHLEAGTVFYGPLTLGADDSGTKEAPITVRSYGDGPGRSIIQAVRGPGIAIENCAWVTIQDLEVRGPGRTNPNGGHGIHVLTKSETGDRFGELRIDNVDVSGFYENGIFVVSKHRSQPGYDGIAIESCVVHDNGLNGIYFDATFRGDVSKATYAHRNTVIRDCKAFGNTGRSGLKSHSGSGIAVSYADGALIDYCEAYNNGELNDAPGGGPVGIWAWECNNVVIQRSESHHNVSKGDGGGGFGLGGGCTNGVMQYNYSHDNAGAGFGIFQFDQAHNVKDNVVRHNIGENDSLRGGGAIHFCGANASGGIYDTLVQNNTVFLGPNGLGAALEETEQETGASCVLNTRVFNNVFVTAPGKHIIRVPDEDGTWEFRGNCYFTYEGPIQIQWGAKTFDKLSDWRSASTQEPEVPLELDPKLKKPGKGGTIGDPHRLHELDAYRLSPDSPLVGRDIGAIWPEQDVSFLLSVPPARIDGPG